MRGFVGVCVWVCGLVGVHGHVFLCVNVTLVLCFITLFHAKYNRLTFLSLDSSVVQLLQRECVNNNYKENTSIVYYICRMVAQ